jgi:PKD repeat protein
VRTAGQRTTRSLSGVARWGSALAGVASAAIVVAMSIGTPTAFAVLVHLKNGRSLSYQSAPASPVEPSGGGLSPKPYDAFFTNLDYNGGPVMPTNTNYAVYWAPKGGPKYPSDYQPGLNRFFEDLAHDSGGHENVESVASQYDDYAGNFATYSSHFGGALSDEDPYPANGCTRAPICLTDAQLRAELKKFVTGHALPTDLSHEYFLLTPEGVEDCFEASGAECSANVTEAHFQKYCAYHGNIAIEGGGELIYANDPFVAGKNCDEANHPNGTSDAALIGGLSHEHIESLTDPEPNNAWTDFGSAVVGEIGDKCRTFTESTEYGAALGNAPDGAKYNQVIDGHLYWYQQEWSNQNAECVQRFTLSGEEPKATFTSDPVKSNEMNFNASGSTAGSGVRYNWQFNDLSHTPNTPVETTSLSVTHKFPSTGSFVVALTVFASDGTSTGTRRTIAIGDEGPTAAFSVTTTSPKAGEAVNFDGSGSTDSDGAIKTFSWNFGDGSAAGTSEKPSHTYLAGGTYTVTLTVTDASGQTTSVSHFVAVGVGKKSQTIEFTSKAPTSASVGGAAYEAKASASSALAVSFASATPTVCTTSGAIVSFVGAGTCTIDANQAGNGEYEPAPQVAQSFSVAKGAQTIEFTSKAPTGASVGGTYEVKATGGASGNPVTFTIDSTSSSVCSISGATVTFKATGTCTIDANQGGNANYEAAPQVAQSFSVAAPGPPPVVRKVTPRKGRSGGGANVTITGSNLSGATAITFGTTTATAFSVGSATKITAVAPPGTSGTVDVRVTTSGGTSATSGSDHFKYGAPTVIKVSPSTGPQAGGTSVIVTGTGFAPTSNATLFSFGFTPAASVQCSSSTTCSMISPAHATGNVDVRVSVSGARSRKSSSDHFTYH